MNQFSENGEAIQLEIKSGQLLFVDPAYFDQITEVYEDIKDIPRSDMKKFIQTLEQKVFPYGGGSLLGFKILDAGSKVYELDIVSVKYYNSDDDEIIEKAAIEKNIIAFGLDTASFLIIDMANFDALIPLLNSDDLHDLDNNPNGGYIEKINTQLGNRGWAFVSSPGVGKGYEFEGDGSYYIEH